MELQAAIQAEQARRDEELRQFYAAEAAKAAVVVTAPKTSKESQHAAHFDPGSVQQLIVDIFGPDAPEALSVAKCESGYDPNAVNPGNPHVRGVFQIHNSWAAKWAEVMGVEYEATWMNAATNVRFAYWLWTQSGWGPWACKP